MWRRPVLRLPWRRAKPLMRCLGVTATARASFYVYNEEADIDALIHGLRRAGEIFGTV